ncbi:alpha/beta hydrolase [Salinibius halmophilus]|uniref:alpha/beta hydrolase n=1 Tax=Salinibius halmophilus TaxID=1853216 RepID=UPI00131430A3|nr:alpha/beta fold hydrolase [Salinibius halmophilus]
MIEHISKTLGTGTNQAVVIWLHGLGASCHDFFGVPEHLRLRSDLRVNFIFPQAPTRAITINNGYQMPGWYDILSLGLDRETNVEHLRESAAAIHQLIDQQVAQGVAPERIALIGFSQGGAVCYETAFQSDRPLAGMIALSTYLANDLPNTVRPLPVEIHHGQQDDVVPFELSLRAKEALSQQHIPVTHKTFQATHTVVPEQLEDISQWLNTHLAR